VRLDPDNKIQSGLESRLSDVVGGTDFERLVEKVMDKIEDLASG
jgi:hypothetical protein